MYFQFLNIPIPPLWSKGVVPPKLHVECWFKNYPHFHSGSISWWSHLAAPVLCKVAWRVIHPDGMSHLKSILDKVTRHSWNTLCTRTQRSMSIWPRLPGRERENLPLCCLLTLVRYSSAYLRTGWMSRALWHKMGYFWFDKALADILLLASASSLMFITSGQNPNFALAGRNFQFCPLTQTLTLHTAIFSAAVSLGKSPELDDTQWNETATSDTVIVTLLFLLLFKKLYTFHSHSECVMIADRASKRGCVVLEKGLDCFHACVQVFV